MKKLFAAILALVMLTALVGCGEQTEPTTTGPRAPAPDFTVYNEKNEQVKLSDFRGKPVVLNFWASWCGTCKAEMPDFQKEFEAYGDRVQFMMVNCTDGSRETVITAAQFMKQSGYSFPVFFDMDYEANLAYGVRSIPTTFFIDAEGYIVAQATGMISHSQLRQGINLICGRN